MIIRNVVFSTFDICLSFLSINLSKTIDIQALHASSYWGFKWNTVVFMKEPLFSESKGTDRALAPMLNPVENSGFPTTVFCKDLIEEKINYSSSSIFLLYFKTVDVKVRSDNFSIAILYRIYTFLIRIPIFCWASILLEFFEPRITLKLFICDTRCESDWRSTQI